MWIVVKGTPGDGFTFVGPFENNEDAFDALDGESDCWVAELEEPDA